MAYELVLDYSSDRVVPWIDEVLSRRGLRVARSFDLKTARAAHTNCSCPHHGTDACDCQMVVLLVYGNDSCPATLVAHGRDGRTYLSLTSIPGQRPSPQLAGTIMNSLALAASSNREHL